jgi:Zn-dependent metalloprotease
LIIQGRYNHCAAFIVLAIAMLAASAGAFTELELNQTLEIPRTQTAVGSRANLEKSIGWGAAEKAMADRYDHSWRVFSWNEQTGTPHLMYGSSPSLGQGLKNQPQWESLGAKVIQDNRAVLKADLRHLQLREISSGAGKTALHYQQTHNGVPVHDAWVKLVFSATGQLVVMGSDYHQEFSLATQPGLDSEAAAAIAQADLPFHRSEMTIAEAPELMILPLSASEGGARPHLVWRVKVRSQSPPGLWISHVDAHDGQIIWRYNDVRFAYSGTTNSDIQPGTYCNGLTTAPMPWLYLDVAGLPLVTTDSAGHWSTVDGGESRSVSSGLEGPYVHVRTNGAGPLAAFTGTALDGVPLPVRFDDSNSQQDERNVFDAVNEVHDFYQLFAPEFEFCHQQMLAEVSIADYCNAYWDGGIHFFQAGGPCVNTGELQDVVFHEYAHGITDAILGSQGYEGCGESNSDIMALLMTNDPVIGRGIVAGDCLSGIRNADNSLVYPDDVIGIPEHTASQVLSGFHWDAMQALRARYGAEQGTLVSARDWHHGRVLLHPLTPPDQVLATFLANDDDGDLTNGSADLDIYSAAALNHGFEPLSGIVITHTPLEDTTDTTAPRLVTASIRSTAAAVDPASVTLYWNLDGGPWQAVPMTHAAGSDYDGWIPAQKSGTVRYYFTAADAIGTTGTHPAAAPTNVHEFQVAWVIYTAEVIGGWQVGAPGDLATSGIWELVNPVGVPGQTEDDYSTSGSHCWITGQYVSGPFDSSDVDGGRTTLLSPVYDLTGAASASIRYWKWFSNDKGPYPYSDPWRVYLSNDAGASWSIAENTTVPTNDWTEVVLDLADYFPEPGQLQVRFEAWDMFYDSLIEAGVDDFAIVADFPATSVDRPQSAAAMSMSQNYPNPFNPSTSIEFNLPRDGVVSLGIFDTRGRLVRTLTEGPWEAGSHTVIWDGRSDRGRALASGVYYYRLRAADKTFSRRMVLLR